MRGSRRRKWKGFAALAAVALFALPASAQALPEDRVYEMVSPPDKNDGDVGAGLFQAPSYAGIGGDRFAYMALGGWNAPANSITGVYVAKRGESFWESKSALLPVLPLPSLGGAVTAGVSPDASHIISITNRNLETGERFLNFNGGAYLLNVETGEAELVAGDEDVDGHLINDTFTTYLGNADFSRFFTDFSAHLTPDSTGIDDIKVFMYEDGELSLQSRLPDNSPTGGRLPSPGANGQKANAVSPDGDVMFFEVGFGSNAGLYRRDFSGPSPVTTQVNVDENPDEDPSPASADFEGATPDGTIVYFTTNQRLVAEDDDFTRDLYRYDHSAPAGSQLELVSVDTETDDSDAAVDRVQAVSEDGSTVVFTSPGQFVDGETTDPGQKLYVARDGTIEFVGNLGTGSGGFLDAREIGLAPDGSQMAFLARASGLTPDDNGGLAQVYVRDNETGELECISCVPGGNTAEAGFSMGANVSWFGATFDGAVRNLSSEGHVFFHTAESLLPQDTNGKSDVYVWQDGELDLLTTGRSPSHSWFADATPDGKDAFFVTREKLSGWDFDDHLDVYTARIGGGLPEPPEPGVPCTGSDCQGPPPLPPAFPSPGTGDPGGPGNADPGPVDCTSAERKVDKLTKQANKLAKKAKRLKKQARKAQGKKAKRLGKRAKQAQRQAKAKRQQARSAQRQLALCLEEAEL